VTAPTATTPPESSGRDPIVRFDALERVVHWLNAGLFIVLLVTAAILYVPELSASIGRRYFVERVHVYCGLALPGPILLGVVLRRWRQGFWLDLSRLNRWSPDDRRWLRVSLLSRPRREVARAELRLGKFNAGQKLNAAFTAGAILVMLATGAVMFWYKPWPLRWRTGATFVHDWVAIAVFVAVLGHIAFATRDRESLSSMLWGGISRRWAERHAPLWLEEIDEIETLDHTASPAPDPAAGSRDRPSG
jgi:cytochrome b subunit of formate dehydrogenase